MLIEAPYVIAAFVSAGGVIAFLYRALIQSKETEIVNLKAQLEEEKSLNATFQDVAKEAIKSAIETTNFYRQKEGKPPLILPSPVVSEGSSPPTTRQKSAALASTMRAVMVIIRESENQEPRREPL